MRALVVGGTGALGRRVVSRLIAAGHDVRATARGAEAAGRVSALGAEPIDVDLYDAAAMRRAVAGRESVLRLTTKIPPLMAMRRASAWTETGRLRNESAALLVDACIAEGVPSYVHESIGFMYADGGERWLDEEAPLDVEGIDPLSRALSGEAHAARFTAAGGRGVVLRYAGFYAADSAQSLVMAKMARHRRMALISPSTNLFSSIHIDDAATAAIAGISAPAGVYNAGDDEPLPLRDVMGAMAAAAGAPPLRRLPRLLGPVVLGATWPYLRRSLRISSRRLREATGWTASIPDARTGWRLIAEEWAGSSDGMAPAG